MVAIDLKHLIDRLEALVTAGIRIPMTSKIVVDEQELLDIVDQLRVAIPDEIRQAKRISAEKDQVIGGAKAEAEKIISSAQERVAMILQDSEIVKLAEQQAETIMAEARRAAEEIRVGADNYALEVLSKLENELNRLLAQARRGMAALEKNTKETATKREHPSVPASSPHYGSGGRRAGSEKIIIDDLAD